MSRKFLKRDESQQSPGSQPEFNVRCLGAHENSLVAEASASDTIEEGLGKELSFRGCTEQFILKACTTKISKGSEEVVSVMQIFVNSFGVKTSRLCLCSHMARLNQVPVSHS